MASVKILNFSLTFFCLIGLGLSIYSYVIEQATVKDENYKAMCDISENVSCTKAFKSKYGKGMGIVSKLLGEDHILNQPNSLLGMIHYSLMATISQAGSRSITFVALLLSIFGLFSSIYFAYILYFILYDLCVVCVGTYVVNILVLLLTYYKLKTVSTVDKKNKMKKKN